MLDPPVSSPKKQIPSAHSMHTIGPRAGESDEGHDTFLEDSNSLKEEACDGEEEHAATRNLHHSEDDSESEDDDTEGGGLGVHAPEIFPERLQGISTATRNRRKRRSTVRQAWEISKEALPTLALSLLSLMFSGELLVHLARWPVFLKVDKLFILIPILLNLKGNLEMNLSLRMSTSANIGELDIRRTRETLIVGNMTLLQVQALIVSAGAGILAFSLGVTANRHGGDSQGEALPVASAPSSSIRALAAPMRAYLTNARTNKSLKSPNLAPRRVIHQHPKPPQDPALRLRNGYFEFVLVLATAMLSASLSSAILGNFMCALVVVARRTGANPDNIASPLAASLGDLMTLVIVGLLGSTLVRFEGTILATLIFLALLVACAICFFFTLRNTYVRELLSSGWVPLILAMFISSGAGLVLDAFVQRFQGFALLTPIVTGLPGACAAIMVSRTSTTLHSGKGDIALGLGPSMGALNGSGGGYRRSGDRSSFVAQAVQAFQGFARLACRPVEGWLVPMTLIIIGAGIEFLFLLFVWVTGQLSFGWPFAVSFALIGVGMVSVSQGIVSRRGDRRPFSLLSSTSIPLYIAVPCILTS